MAIETDVILTRFEGDIADLKAKLTELEKEYGKLGETIKKPAEDEKKLSKELVTAAQKRKSLLIAEQAELKRLQTAAKSAFTVKDIDEFNRKITTSKNNISLLKGEVSSVGKLTSGAGSQFLALGAGIAAAFSVQAVIAFGKASIDAFLEAEQNAARLKSSLGGNEEQFERLIAQSERLAQAGKTIFTDDDIQRAQTALAQFGLTADQIELLIPGLADFASALQINIVEAAEKVGTGLQGAGREFKKFGIDVSATNSELENLNIITEGFIQFQGRAAAETQTLAGQLSSQKRAAEELQETLGEKLAPTFVQIKNDIFGVILAFKNLFTETGRLENLLDGLGISATDAATLIDSGFRKMGRSNEEIQIAAKSAAGLKQTLDAIVESMNRQGVEADEVSRALVQLNKQLFFQDTFTNEGQVNTRLYAAAIKELRERYQELTGPITKTTDLTKLLESQLVSLRKATEGKTDLTSKDLLKRIDDEIAARKKAAEAAKKAADEAAKAKEAQFQRELSGIQTGADAERAVVALVATDKATLEKDLTRITGDELGKQLDLYNKFNKDTKDIISQIADLNVKEAQDRLEAIEKGNADIFDSLVKSAEDAGKKESEIFFKGLNERREAEGQAEKEQQRRQEKLRDASLQAAQSIADAVFQIQRNNIDRQQRLEFEALDAEKERALSNKRLTDAEITRINEQFAAKELALQKKQFEQRKSQATREAVIQGALATVEALPNYFLVAAVVATTLAEIAVIQSQKFAKGKKPGQRGGLSLVGEEGPEYMYVPNQASILTAKQSKKHKALISAMQGKETDLDAFIHHNYVLPLMERQTEKSSKKKDQNFIDNFSKSLIYNGLTEKGFQRGLKGGTKLTNAKEIAEEIAKALGSKGYDARRAI